MCMPSATRAIEPKIRPPIISSTIRLPQSAMTVQVRRSALAWPSPKKTWLCPAGMAEGCTSLIDASLKIGADNIDQLISRFAVQSTGMFFRIDQMCADVILDHFDHEAG